VFSSDAYILLLSRVSVIRMHHKCYQGMIHNALPVASGPPALVEDLVFPFVAQRGPEEFLEELKPRQLLGQGQEWSPDDYDCSSSSCFCLPHSAASGLPEKKFDASNRFNYMIYLINQPTSFTFYVFGTANSASVTAGFRRPPATALRQRRSIAGWWSENHPGSVSTHWLALAADPAPHR